MSTKLRWDQEKHRVRMRSSGTVTSKVQKSSPSVQAQQRSELYKEQILRLQIETNDHSGYWGRHPCISPAYAKSNKITSELLQYLESLTAIEAHLIRHPDSAKEVSLNQELNSMLRQRTIVAKEAHRANGGVLLGYFAAVFYEQGGVAIDVDTFFRLALDAAYEYSYGPPQTEEILLRAVHWRIKSSQPGIPLRLLHKFIDIGACSSITHHNVQSVISSVRQVLNPPASCSFREQIFPELKRPSWEPRQPQEKLGQYAL